MATSIPDISAAIERLRGGGVVAFPTETVYGLGADALNERAVGRVYELKGRPSANPLIVHVSGPEMAARLVEEWTPEADALARMFWPGPLTLVLPRANGAGAGALVVPEIVTGGGDTIGVRCPDHPVALALLFGLGSPLVGPSANVSGSVSPTMAAHVSSAFRAEDVLVLEGGPCRAGIESTVVSLAGTRAKILRPGLIGAGEIAAVIGRPVEEGAAVISPSPGAALPSPGLLARHYAPRTPAKLVEIADLERMASELRAAGKRVVIITHETKPARFPGSAPAIAQAMIELPNDPLDYAFHLYASLRAADEEGGDVILIARPPSEEGAWGAIMDRLRRATTEA